MTNQKTGTPELDAIRGAPPRPAPAPKPAASSQVERIDPVRPVAHANGPTPAPSQEPVAQWGQIEERPMDEVTLAQFENLLHETYKLQDQVEEKEREAAEIKKHLEDRKAKLLAVFQKFEKTSYRISRGLAVRQKRFNVQMPKEPGPRLAFFEFLRQRKVFDDMVTVNHNTLNAFYKAEMETAVKEGNMEFSLPGIGEPKYNEILVLRRNR